MAVLKSLDKESSVSGPFIGCPTLTESNIWSSRPEQRSLHSPLSFQCLHLGRQRDRYESECVDESDIFKVMNHIFSQSACPSCLINYIYIFLYISFFFPQTILSSLPCYYWVTLPYTNSLSDVTTPDKLSGATERVPPRALKCSALTLSWRVTERCRQVAMDDFLINPLTCRWKEWQQTFSRLWSNTMTHYSSENRYMGPRLFCQRQIFDSVMLLMFFRPEHHSWDKFHLTDGRRLGQENNTQSHWKTLVDDDCGDTRFGWRYGGKLKQVQVPVQLWNFAIALMSRTQVVLLLLMPLTAAWQRSSL